MALHSNLFRSSSELQTCLINDRAHVAPGSRGRHVKLIQRALVMLGDTKISRKEYIDGYYGPTTTAAVLTYKRRWNIINYTYEKSVDNIVGKMTIAALDDDALSLEMLPRFND